MVELLILGFARAARAEDPIAIVSVTVDLVR
jgi:hypothetical protein